MPKKIRLKEDRPEIGGKYLHLTSGVHYRVLDVVLHVTNGVIPFNEVTYTAIEGEQKGEKFARRMSEFMDGRFKLVWEEKQTPTIPYDVIAARAVHKLYWAMENLKAPGSGMLMTVGPRKDVVDVTRVRHWHESFIEIIELVPGYKVDREMLHISCLPKRARNKAYIALAKKRGVTTQQLFS